LNEFKLRIVDRSEWKLQPDIDDKGHRKVTEMEGFKYVFADSSGKIYDLRPQDTKPSYNNFIKRVRVYINITE
jgi:hypothetical protein